MAKELPFFKFEISEYMFGRIQKQPLDVQGTFINLCCKYWHKLGELSMEDACLDFVPEHIEALIKSKIVRLDSDFLVISFMDAQLDECAAVSKTNSVKGKKSAEMRAKRKSTKSNSGSTAVEIGSTPVQPQLTGTQQQSTDLQPDSTEEKRREHIYGEGTVSIAIRKKYANEDVRRIFDLRLYFDAEGQIPDLELKGWVHYQPFLNVNAGRVFNDSDHVYNSFRSFCLEYKPPEASNEFSEAEYNKTLWVLPEWEKFYSWRLNNQPDFRKHFGYGKLQARSQLGSNNNGHGSAEGNDGVKT